MSVEVFRRRPLTNNRKVRKSGVGGHPQHAIAGPARVRSLKSVMKRLSHARRFIQVQLNHLAILQRESIRAESL
jgi:hypothetical protein